MFIFVTDACAIARIYANDIGTSNMRQIYRYLNSRIMVPNIAYAEAISALLSLWNGGTIDETEYRTAKMALDADIANNIIRTFRVSSFQLQLGISFLEKYKHLPGHGGLGGADSLYFAFAKHLSERLSPHGNRVILVTSDGPLYNATLAEPDVEVFHFWTCDLGCGHTTFIPTKGAPQPPKPPNQCPVCLKTCPICRVDVCPSSYIVRF